jgi:hypothetical protein
MKTMKYASHHHPALEQLQTNTCSWIGHMDAGSVDHLAGQTFECPDDGELDNIQVYSAAVPHPGKVILTLHSFDSRTKTWGPILSSSEIKVGNDDAEHWMHFRLPAVVLHKNNTYGFRLKSPDALVAVGEAVWPGKSPFVYGEEWNSNNNDRSDHYYRYFSLAFKVEMRA